MTDIIISCKPWNINKQKTSTICIVYVVYVCIYTHISITTTQTSEKKQANLINTKTLLLGCFMVCTKAHDSSKGSWSFRKASKHRSTLPRRWKPLGDAEMETEGSSADKAAAKFNKTALMIAAAMFGNETVKVIVNDFSEDWSTSVWTLEDTWSFGVESKNGQHACLWVEINGNI